MFSRRVPKSKFIKSAYKYFNRDDLVAYGSLVLPIITYALGWDTITIIIAPFAVAPLILFIFQHLWEKDHPGGIYNHKQARGVMMFIVFPLSLLFWIVMAVIADLSST